MHSVFITGSNRGIGLEFVKQYAEKNWIVYASCRNPEKAVHLRKLSQKHKNVKINKLDISSEKDISQLKIKFKKIPIDILINNAGILDKKRIPLQKLSTDDFINVFSVNAISPLFVTRALLPSLKRGNLKIVASISSVIASLKDNYGDRWNHYTYKVSKTALNMIMSCLSVDPDYSDLRVLLLDPGWVKTDMGGKEANLSPRESVSGMLKVIHSKKKHSRAFINFQGKIQAW